MSKRGTGPFWTSLLLGLGFLAAAVMVGTAPLMHVPLHRLSGVLLLAGLALFVAGLGSPWSSERRG